MGRDFSLNRPKMMVANPLDGGVAAKLLSTIKVVVGDSFLDNQLTNNFVGWLLAN